jgi:hypothetical protein
LIVAPLADGWLELTSVANTGTQFFLTGRFWGTAVIGNSKHPAQKTISSESASAFVIRADHHLNELPMFFSFMDSSDRKSTVPTYVERRQSPLARVLHNKQLNRLAC